MKNEPENKEGMDDLPLEIYGISGGIWDVAPVSERPEIVLTDWHVFEVAVLAGPERTRHFAGQNFRDREGRVSSAITTFDASTGRGITRSGRVYELRGRPGFTPDGQYVWNRWKALNEAADIVDATAEIRGLLGR